MSKDGFSRRGVFVSGDNAESKGVQGYVFWNYSYAIYNVLLLLAYVMMVL